MPVPTVATGANPYGPQINFRTEEVAPPAAVYIGPDDALLLDARAPTVPAPLHLTLRRLNPDGEISSDQYDMQISTTGTQVQEFIVPPAEGYLLSAHCRSETPERGQLFVKLHARRNVAGTDQALGQLFFQGYISADDHLGYPQSPTESSVAGRGWLRAVRYANPPVATDLQITVPAGVRWILRSFQAYLNTGTLPGPIYPYLVVSDSNVSTQYAMSFPAGGPANTGTASRFDWAPGLAALTNPLFVTGPIPDDLIVPAGWYIIAAGAAQGTGAQWTQAVLVVEEYVAV